MECRFWYVDDLNVVAMALDDLRERLYPFRVSSPGPTYKEGIIHEDDVPPVDSPSVQSLYFHCFSKVLCHALYFPDPTRVSRC